MEIKKGSINLKETKGKMSAGNLVSGDVVIPDTMPDIEEVVVADAKARICDTTYKNGKLDVSGVVDFTVLYKPEEGSELKSVCQGFDFLQSFDVKADEETEFNSEAFVEHISFAQVNSRKISAKMMLCIAATGSRGKEYSPITEICGDDIESRNKKYSMYIPMSETVTGISVSDILTLPEEKTDIGTILKTDAWAVATETKVMNGKVMICATLNLCTVYSASDEKGTVTGVMHTIPFTEIAEAPGADEQCAVNVYLNTESVTAAGKGDLNGDTRIISVDAEISAKVKVSKTVAETFVDDCYFLSQKTNLCRENMEFFEYITSENGRITERQAVKIDDGKGIAEIISCTAKPILKEVKCSDKKAIITGNLVSFLIYRDGEGCIKSAVTESDVSWEKMIGCESFIEADMWLEDVSAELTGNGAQILANIGIFMKAMKTHNIEILTDCSPKDESDTTKYPSLVVYFAKDGDTVWNVAKKYRTKCEKIMSANGLEKETIEQGRRILIPKA